MKRQKKVPAATRTKFNSCVTYGIPASGLLAIYSGPSNFKKRKDAKNKQTEQVPQTTAQPQCEVIPADGKHEILFQCEKLQPKTGDKMCELDELRKTKQIDRRRMPLRSISPTGRKHIREKASALFGAGRCSTFVTLSFIAPVADKIALRCLQNFIRSWRLKWGQSINYLWVAERQMNGNIHFHLLTSKFFDIQEENNRWTKVQYNQGLLGQSSGGEIYDKKFIWQAIKNGELKKYLNPFDTKKVHDIAGVKTYITKYIIKPDAAKGGTMPYEFEIRPWAQSQRSARTVTGMLTIPELFQELLSKKNIRVQKKDYWDKETGELIYPAGYVHKVVPYFGYWAHVVNVLNYDLNKFATDEMNRINYRVLAEGEKLKKEYISEYDYYVNYCRPVTPDIIENTYDPPAPSPAIDYGYYYQKDGVTYHSGHDKPVSNPGRYKLRRGGFHDVGCALLYDDCRLIKTYEEHLKIIEHEKSFQNR